MTTMDSAKGRLSTMHNVLRTMIWSLDKLDQDLQNIRTIADNYLTVASANGEFATEYLRVVEEDVLTEALAQADEETLQKLIRALRQVQQLDDEGT